MKGLDVECLDLVILNVLNAAREPELKRFYDSFIEKRYLTENERVELLDIGIKNQARVWVNLYFDLPNVPPPNGWYKIKCAKCHRTVTAIARNPDACVLCAHCIQADINRFPRTTCR